MVSKMAYESIVPNPVKTIPNSDVTMKTMIVPLPDNAGATVNPIDYIAQSAAYYNDVLKPKKVVTRKPKKSSPRIKGLNTKVKSLVPRTIEGMDFILGPKNDKKVIDLGIDLNKLGDKFRKPCKTKRKVKR